MTQAAAIAAFYSSFGIDAYPENAVPNDAKMPYLTYELKMGYFGDRYSSAINLYYRTESEKKPNDKAKEIGDVIGYGGKLLPCEDGTIWITRAEPWFTPINQADEKIKRRQLMTYIEFL